MIKACEKKIADIADEDTIQEIYDMYLKHAERINGDNEETEKHNMKEHERTNGMRGKEYDVEEWKTLFIGGEEIYNSTQIDGTTIKKARNRAGLEPGNDREKRLPPHLQVTTKAIEEAIDMEALKVIQDTDNAHNGLPSESRDSIEEWIANP